MQRVNEFIFFDTAVKVHGLCEMFIEDTHYTVIAMKWWDARSALDEIYKQRPLNFTTRAAYSLYEAISHVVPTDFTAMVEKYSENGGRGPLIQSWQINTVRNAALEFETVLRNECQIMDTYHVVKRGVYSTRDLIENAHKHLPSPVCESVPEMTRLDLDQAGKCLAFGVPTAAAFHLLRATESVIRKYYELAVPGNRKASSKMRNWGSYIKLLASHNANPAAIGMLTSLKDLYRNPVLHPEEVYSDDKVQVLFGLCVSAIILLETECISLEEKSLSLNLPELES